jgi:folate-dependent phosphoribosylglycinamide formyltransferase PurN
MNVCVMTSSKINLGASVLMARLRKQSDKPVCIMSTERSQLATLRSYIKKFGYIATARKVLGHYNVIQSSGTDLRSYLREYAASHDLADWDAPLTRLCSKYGIEFVNVESINSSAAVNLIKDRNIDVIVNMASGIFRKPIIGAARMGILNAHMGYLPTFRGMNVLEWSLFYGHRIGVTMYFIARGIDTGDILLFEEIPIVDGDTIDSLRAKSAAVNMELFAEAIKRLREGTASRTEQKLEDGKQYFVMHPRLREIAQRRIPDLLG